MNSYWLLPLSSKLVPDEVIALMAAFSKAVDEGKFDNVNNTTEVILGRKPITVSAYLQQVYGSR